MRRIGSLVMAVVVGATGWTQTTVRVSVGPVGVQGNFGSLFPALSPDARWVAFASGATNLVAGDTNGRTDIFVHDRPNVTERVSVGPGGVQANHESSPNSEPVSITPDGRYVVFASDASNLVAGDTNARTDIFVRDRQLATTERVSVGAGGAQGNDLSRCARFAISSDGRYVAFSSLSTNLVAGDTNGFEDVFVRDRLLGTTERASVATGGAQANHFNHQATITPDGRYVAWTSDATNLVAGDTNASQDVYLRDRTAGTTERVSVGSLGVQGNTLSSQPALSDDGRYVAFASQASNLVPGDVNGNTDSFLRDRQNATTELVSLDSNETHGDGLFGSTTPTPSSDGRHVVFYSDASNLVPGDTNETWDAFLRDRLAGTTERVSLTSSGGEVNANSVPAAITPEGRWIAFYSPGSNVVPGDTNNDHDIFLRDRLCVVSEAELVSVDSAEVQGNQPSAASSISADGRWIAIASPSSNLVPGDTNGNQDIFLRDRVAGTTEIVSLGQGGVPGNGDSSDGKVSADGRYVAFHSDASNLVPGDTNSQIDVFVHDRLTGTTDRVSIDSAGNQAPLISQVPDLSADGRYVVFRSRAGLVPADTNGTVNVYVRDRVAGTTVCASVDSSGAIGNSPGDESWDTPALSADGRYVVFSSSASNLVPNDTNDRSDVFLHDRTTGATERISVGPGGVQTNDHSSFVSISSDGRWIGFGSHSSNLVPGDTNGEFDVFLCDRVTTTIERISISTTGEQGNESSFGSSYVSGDGRYVLFGGYAANLVPDDTNGQSDVFLRDRLLGTTERVGVGPYGVQPNAYTGVGAISSDGQTVVFNSEATNFLAWDANGIAWDAYVHTSPEQPGFMLLCEPGANGVIACPCGNPPAAAGRGCDNSAATGGAKLAASGLPCLSMDSVILTTSAELPTATSIVLQGSVPLGSGVAFGQGVRCVGGSLLRLYIEAASGGSMTEPDLAAGEPSISARSAALGSPISGGQSRWYLVYYRDPVVLGGCPNASTFNATPTLRIRWGM